MASTSCAKQGPVMNFVPYPTPKVKYEDVAADPKVFLSTLEELHAFMGTKFMIPIIGGRELDLHRLFLEVTSRGGIEKILGEKRWKEVTALFNFPSTATNASFVLRKYYGSLLYHYEQLYFFKAQGWSRDAAVASRNPMIARVPAQVTVQPSPEYQAAAGQQQWANPADFHGAKAASSSSGCPVTGVIDGKFESGYLVTVTIGSEKFKGVLYQAPQTQSFQALQSNRIPVYNSGNVPVSGTQHRRRRRKKCEIKRRDPAHPKPNRSGYNFFFAEQHARLKPLHPGKDREISRMIGELWNNLKEPERAVYQDKAIKDKERYRTEMEDYRERLRTGKVVSDAVPLQQWLPEQDSDMVEADVKTVEMEGGDSPHTPENESSSREIDSEDAEKDLDVEACPAGESNADMETSSVDLETSKNEEKVGDGMNENAAVGTSKEVPHKHQ